MDSESIEIVCVADIELQLVTEKQGPAGPMGPQGPAGPSGSGSGSGYIFTQSTPNATWMIPHNLGKYPNVCVFGTDGVQMLANVTNLDINVTQIDFSVAISGYAVLIA